MANYPRKPRPNKHLGKPYQFYGDPTEFDAALALIQQAADKPTAAAAMRYAILETAKRMRATQEPKP